MATKVHSDTTRRALWTKVFSYTPERYFSLSLHLSCSFHNIPVKDIWQDFMRRVIEEKKVLFQHHKNHKRLFICSFLFTMDYVHEFELYRFKFELIGDKRKEANNIKIMLIDKGSGNPSFMSFTFHIPQQWYFDISAIFFN